jgi:hypothetical protein
MLVGGVVVEDRVDHPAGRYGALHCVEEFDEILVPMACQAAADDLAFEDV